jgi:hypothetical protein
LYLAGYEVALTLLAAKQALKNPRGFRLTKL